MRVWVAAQRGIAAIVLVLLLPVLLAIGLAVRLDSKGPAIYRARRVGQHGVAITVHKFRTMAWSPDQSPGSAITALDDGRVTRAGRRLRSAHLDELPQLWDVVVGRMALVGPRPEAPEFVDRRDERWTEILSVPPGITGATQLAFADEAKELVGPDPARTYREEVLPLKIRADLDYVRRRSVLWDLRIALATILRSRSRNKLTS